MTPTYTFDQLKEDVRVEIGRVVNDKGHVQRWKDCVSEGSVKRFIDSQKEIEL